MKVFVMMTLCDNRESFEVSGVYATKEDALAHCRNERMAFAEFEMGVDVSDINKFMVYSLEHPDGLMTTGDVK